MQRRGGGRPGENDRGDAVGQAGQHPGVRPPYSECLRQPNQAPESDGEEQGQPDALSAPGGYAQSLGQCEKWAHGDVQAHGLRHGSREQVVAPEVERCPQVGRGGQDERQLGVVLDEAPLLDEGQHEEPRANGGEDQSTQWVPARGVVGQRRRVVSVAHGGKRILSVGLYASRFHRGHVLWDGFVGRQVAPLCGGIMTSARLTAFLHDRQRVVPASRPKGVGGVARGPPFWEARRSSPLAKSRMSYSPPFRSRRRTIVRSQG